MLIRTRRHDSRRQETEVDDSERIAAVLFAVSAAGHRVRKPVLRVLCASI